MSLLMAYQVKEQVIEETRQNILHLDIGCNNYIHRNNTTFSTLDESYRDFFGNDSKVTVMGKG